MINVVAQALGLSFPSPYMQYVASNFENGANFAVVGAIACDTDSFVAPISLSVHII